MASITSTLKLYDAMTGPLKRITQSMNILISTMHKMQNTANQNISLDRALSAAKEQIALAEIEIKKAIDQSTMAQQRFNQQVAEGTKRINRLLSRLESIATAYLSFSGAQAIMRISDEYVNIQSRLNMINDGLQTTTQLQNKIFAAANRSRGSYQAMASAVGRLGLLAGEAFKNNDEIIAFTELMQKAFKVSGASAMEQEAAMYQLTQAMAAGRLQGDEFRSIMENAPLLADAIARFTRKSKAELKEMSAEGLITAEIIKGALFSVADEINKKFNTMPMTFADVANLLKNRAFQAFGPILQRINQFLNSPAGINFINNLSQAIFIAAIATDQLISVLIYLFNLVSRFLPEIAGALLTIGASYLPMLITKLWAMVPPILAQVKAWALAHLPILLIASAVGVLIFILRKLGVTTEQVVGFIAGLFFTLFAILRNIFALLWNNILAYAEFLANVFVDPIYAIKKLFYDLVKNVIDYFTNMINSIIKGLNWIIEKVNQVAGTSFRTIELWSNDWIEKYKPTTSKNVVDLSKYRWEQIDLASAYQRGYRWATSSLSKLASTISGIGKLPELKMGAIPEVGKVGEVGKIRDTVDISSEDLRIMRELAEMKAIQNFVTLTPTVTVHTGPISKDVDVDEVIARIKQTLEMEIASSARGAWSV